MVCQFYGSPIGRVLARQAARARGGWMTQRGGGQNA
jgi:hypothetical protein